MLKRIICAAVLLAVLGFCAYAQNEPAVSARSAVLMEAGSGTVLFAKNEHERLGVASTTKIMTALLTIEQASPGRVVTAAAQAVQVEGTSMGLQVGDEVSLQALVVGMLLPSGNDAANTAALAVSGSFGAFADLMNRKAAALGMADTHFVTPSGLDDKEHYSTAYDMALLGCYAVKNPLFVEVCSAEKATVCFGKEPQSRTFRNHNSLLRTLPGTLGVKTGFTKKSGRCLVSAVERDGVLLVCVTLNDPNDWADHKELYDYGFSLVQRSKVPTGSASVPVFGSASESVTVRTAEELFVTTLTDPSQLQVRVFTPPYCFAPVKKGQVLGFVAVYERDRCVASTALLAQEDVKSNTEEIKTDGLLVRVIRWFKNHLKQGS